MIYQILNIQSSSLVGSVEIKILAARVGVVIMYRHFGFFASSAFSRTFVTDLG